MSAAAPEPTAQVTVQPVVRDRPLRRRIVECALTLTAEVGWPAVTMGRLAAEVGVSRQTVYNEVGGRTELAEAMVTVELARFLAVVEEGFEAHPDDARAAIFAAVRGVLDGAAGDPVLRAVLGPGGGAEADVLPLLTSRSAGLLAAATSVVAARVARFAPHLDEATVAEGAEAVVRLVLSHVVQPGEDVEQSAATVTWVAVRLLNLPRPA